MSQQQYLSSGWTYDETNKLWDLVKEKLKETKPRLSRQDFEDIKTKLDNFFAGKMVQVGDAMWPRAEAGVVPPIAWSSSGRPFPKRTANALHSYMTKKDSPRSEYYEALCRDYVI